MERKRKESSKTAGIKANRKAKLVLAVVTVGVIVGLSFIAGYILSISKLSPIVQSLDQDQQTLNTLLLTASLDQNTSISCPLMTAGLGALGQQLSSLYSEVSGVQDGYPLPSKYYSVESQLEYLRLNFWLLSQRIYQTCGHRIVTALMFYPANTVCVDCGYEGAELSNIAYLSNYTFEPTVIGTNFNISEVYALEKAYNVTTYPTLIIDGKYSITGYKTTSQLISDICEYVPANFSIC